MSDSGAESCSEEVSFKNFHFSFCKKCTISGEDQDGRGFYDRHPLSIDCFYSRPALRGKKISSFFVKHP